MGNRKRTAKPAPRQGLSSRSKWIILGVLGGILVIGGGVWGYYELTTIPPPDLATAKSDDVADFLGSKRGFGRLSIDDRQDFLIRTVQHYDQGEPRQQFAESLNRMSRRERQVFIDSFSDVCKERAVEQAREFETISKSSRHARIQFVDNAIRNFERMRHPLRSTSAGPGGSAAPVPSLGDVFKNDLPKGSDELMKVVVSRTSAKERAEIKPFIDAVASRYKSLKDSGELERMLAGLRSGS